MSILRPLLLIPLIMMLGAPILLPPPGDGSGGTDPGGGDPPPPPPPAAVIADCAGWSLAGTAPESGYMVASASLLKDIGNGTFVEVSSSSDHLLVATGGTPVVMQNTWDTDLFAGLYRVDVTQTMFGGTFAAIPTATELDGVSGVVTVTQSEVFSCEGAVNASALTPGYWKNHEEVWTNTLLSLGSPNPYVQADLLVLMDTSVKGDIRVILAKHLIAAKLNLLAGVDAATPTGVPDPSSVIMDTIEAADAYLSQFPAYDASAGFTGPKPSGNLKAEGVLIKNALDVFNNGD